MWTNVYLATAGKHRGFKRLKKSKKRRVSTNVECIIKYKTSFLALLPCRWQTNVNKTNVPIMNFFFLLCNF